VQVLNKTVVFYLGGDRGSFGFARVPGARSDEIWNMPGHADDEHQHGDFPEYEGGNDRVGRRIGGDWFLMYDSYSKVKVGWS
jgi:hypothetical protein